MDALHAIPADQPLVICATGKYIGEGFDESRLDTLFLTMPISWKGTLAQYARRLHRLHDGKREVRVYDYVDTSVEMLERMYHKRLKGYAAIGYQVSADRDTASISGDVIYDQNTFVRAFLKDLEGAKHQKTLYVAKLRNAESPYKSKENESGITLQNVMPPWHVYHTSIECNPLGAKALKDSRLSPIAVKRCNP